MRLEAQLGALDHHRQRRDPLSLPPPRATPRPAASTPATPVARPVHNAAWHSDLGFVLDCLMASLAAQWPSSQTQPPVASFCTPSTDSNGFANNLAARCIKCNPNHPGHTLAKPWSHLGHTLGTPEPRLPRWLVPLKPLHQMSQHAGRAPPARGQGPAPQTCAHEHSTA